MEILSLARKTDILFMKNFAEVNDKKNYVAIKTPQTPNFHWGNYLIFNNPPQKGDLIEWEKIFQNEFSYYDSEKPNHYLFTWSNSQAKRSEINEFLEAGYELDEGIVLTATSVVRPNKYNDSIKVKKIISENEWGMATSNRALASDEKYFSSFEASLQFSKERMEEFRDFTKDGSGDWFGAFIGDQLVGGLGIYYEGDLGRFQMVSTHPDYQRQGICSTLVCQTARIAFKQYNVKTLVMEADADYHAAKIYESVGFRPTETNYSLSWWKGIK